MSPHYSFKLKNLHYLSKKLNLHTSCTSANTSECTSATAAILFIRVGVTEFLGHGAISQPNLDVGQISPVGSWSQGDVTHPTFNQSTHVLRTQKIFCNNVCFYYQLK